MSECYFLLVWSDKLSVYYKQKHILQWNDYTVILSHSTVVLEENERLSLIHLHTY